MLFFLRRERKVIEIERSPSLYLLVSNVPRGWASGFTAVGEGEQN